MSGHTLVGQLYGVLDDSMLAVADRGFLSYADCRHVSATGADLLWRVRSDKAVTKWAFIEEL